MYTLLVIPATTSRPCCPAIFWHYQAPTHTLSPPWPISRVYLTCFPRHHLACLYLCLLYSSSPPSYDVPLFVSTLHTVPTLSGVLPIILWAMHLLYAPRLRNATPTSTLRACWVYIPVILLPIQTLLSSHLRTPCIDLCSLGIYTLLASTLCPPGVSIPHSGIYTVFGSPYPSTPYALGSPYPIPASMPSSGLRTWGFHTPFGIYSMPPSGLRTLY